MTNDLSYRPLHRIPDEIDQLVALLEAYMRETFSVPWHGTREALERDGFGARFDVVVAAQDGRLVAFAALRPQYDLHHCMPGVEVMDMYVEPALRGRGVAVRMLARVAADAAREGARFLVGQAVEDPAMHRLYRRFTRCFPGQHCYLGGRAFRALADAADRPIRALVSALPRPEWNYEP
jgi:GNAT superfamily N-acetyltransferase